MRQFIFSHDMKLEGRAVIEALMAIEWLTMTQVYLVQTDDPKVAELLSGLDTSEEIPARETAAPEANAKREYKRKQSAGPLVECPVCHVSKVSEQITKAGICKPCRMRELKVAKSQAVEMSQAVPPATEAPITPIHTAIPLESQHRQENRAERLARPKETINLEGLSGRRLG